MPDLPDIPDIPDIIVLGDGVLAAAVVVALSPRRLLWVRRAGPPPSAPALAAPGRPSDWVAASAAARRRMQRSAAWFAAMRAPARALPVIADRPAAGAPPDPDADALRLIVADTRRLWRALLAAARARAVPALRAASAAPLFAADGRCIGVITRRRTLPARLVIRTIGLHPTPSLWIDAAARRERRRRCRPRIAHRAGVWQPRPERHPRHPGPRAHAPPLTRRAAASVTRARRPPPG